jgi:hypothetical protein
MLVEVWLKMVGALTPDNMKLLKARGCASEVLALLDAIDKLAWAWRRTEPGPMHKRDWDDVQIRLGQLRDALREG